MKVIGLHDSNGAAQLLLDKGLADDLAGAAFAGFRGVLNAHGGSLKSWEDLKASHQGEIQCAAFAAAAAAVMVRLQCLQVTAHCNN